MAVNKDYVIYNLSEEEGRKQVLNFQKNKSLRFVCEKECERRKEECASKVWLNNNVHECTRPEIVF